MPSLTYTDRLERENRMLRSELMRLRPLTTPAQPEPLSIPHDIWRLLVQFCHPDHHGNRPAATRATQWLLEHRP